MPFKREERANGKKQFRLQTENDADKDGISCASPKTCLLANMAVKPDETEEYVKVVCNNPGCTESNFMHKICFDHWEEEVLTFLRSSGRARSWSEKQRRQNLWTKKGYDLAWKACSCKCTKGHLRKDLDYFPKKVPVEEKKMRRKKKATPSSASSSASCGTTEKGSVGTAFALQGSQSRSRPVTRQSSISSTGSTENFSPSSWDSFGSGSASPGGSSGRSTSRFEFASSRGSTDSLHEEVTRLRGAGVMVSGYSNTFLHRLDLKSFEGILPKNKINPYHIKMEEDQYAGCDETRTFVLTNLSANRRSVVNCILCRQRLQVFDTYPLIDGTFFQTPRKHGDFSIQVFSNDKHPLYLNAVCMLCLESVVICKVCKTQWDGSCHQLGTMYSYDIFAATPCCPSHLSCTNCKQLVIDSQHKLQYFSDYSHSYRCPHCGFEDFHFVKPVNSTYKVIH